MQLAMLALHVVQDSRQNRVLPVHATMQLVRGPMGMLARYAAIASRAGLTFLHRLSDVLAEGTLVVNQDEGQFHMHVEPRGELDDVADDDPVWPNWQSKVSQLRVVCQ
jgi:hypothetical protein